MKAFIVIQGFIILVGIGALALAANQSSATAYFLGAGIVLLNLLLLIFFWDLILKKKLIALVSLGIVFKYAIFAVIIYRVLSTPEIDHFWFLAGLGTLMPTLIVYIGYQKSLKVVQ